MVTAGQLSDALRRAGVPHVSVSIGTAEDRATWRIDYAPEATPEQQSLGESLRLTYDPDSDPAVLDEEAKRQVDGDKALKAAMTAVLWQTKGVQPTAADVSALRTKFLTVYKTL